jgi:pyruvate/2-oxoglutarate dehydrogenase complex dihydrolipoamide dehydrogenase (E3) component
VTDSLRQTRYKAALQQPKKPLSARRKVKLTPQGPARFSRVSRLNTRVSFASYYDIDASNATMPTADHYDTISIGSGEAGKYICWTRASTGNKTAVIEHKWLGGSCPNTACLPSKNIIYSAEVVHEAKRFAASGLLKPSSDLNVDMNMVRERKREMVRGLVGMHEGVFESSGAELVLGRGRLIEPKTVEVELKNGGRRVMTADHVIICTGSRARIDDIPGLGGANPLTHVELLELDEIPKHLIILSGGYSGIEFAQAYRRFGAEVTVVERNARILAKADEDVSSALIDILRAEGIKFYTSTVIEKVTGTSGQSVNLTGMRDNFPFLLSGSHLLVTSGRIPNTEDVGLERVGVELSPSGHVKVDEYLQTSVPGIFAVGDCAGSPQFTHIGFDDFRIVRDFLNKTTPLRSAKARQVPYTLYTSPELAHVGLSEDDAMRKGIAYRLAKVPMAAFLRTRTMDATQGFAKALVSSTDDTILGFIAIGPRAGELLPVVQLAMANALPYTSLSELIVTHPTLGEGMVALFMSVPSRG